jgi:dTDP-4-amino-4,6-dideoxygalactose transaminase
MTIPFNRPYLTGRESAYIEEAMASRHLAGGGDFTRRCHALLEQQTGCGKALLTTSCTAALEMAAILANLEPGDEVIMPSFTFVSTANAFVLRGAVPVFVDVREDTLNLDETLIEAAITPRTRAIVPVHYAGVSCEMDDIMRIAERHELLVIEDAAQVIAASYNGKPVGTQGHLAALSFHETKNIVSGEGGALLINDGQFESRAEVIWEKGTNRSQFFRGQVDKYTWVDVGSSFLPSELIAAFLCAQLESTASITERRCAIWNRYHSAFGELEAEGTARRPIVPSHCRHNAHLYYLLLTDLEARTAFIAKMKESGVQTVFHYVPLHDSPAGKKYGRAHGHLPVTAHAGDGLVRLPFWLGVEDQQQRVIDAAMSALST